MRADLPTGTVTFVFTDVEGSTRLLHELGGERYAAALAEHREIVRAAAARHGGVEVDTQGDAFFLAFPTAPGALSAVDEALTGLERTRIRVRVGVHTGTPVLTAEGYVGDDVHRAARIAACAHGGQVLVSAATAALAAGTALRDLGEHRLKDLSAPERILQVGEGDFPRLKTLAQTNLPVPATPFLGREAEVEEVSALLARPEERLLTLTGAGGTGKTRLALQAAGAAADAFDAGVWWVPLAALGDPAVVVDSAARAVGAGGDLAEHIGSKRMLFLFDNFEHVIAAAPDVAALLDACPALTVLVTSREPLRLEGERIYAVHPLRESDAVALFETRARSARRDFAAGDEAGLICARLDNLPLAIELAAARVTVLSPAALLDRLERALPVLAGGPRNAPERQRTLRTTIEWSHELLGGDERTLFRRLGVFAGGATLDACEAVCDADLDGLSSLVDKSLVRQTDDRFWLLETIREFALERLDAAGETDELRERHAGYFLGLVSEAAPALLSEYMRTPGPGLADAERELPNYRLALQHLVQTGDPRALELAVALYPVWIDAARAGEGLRRTVEALEVEREPSVVRARALHAAAGLAGPLGEIDEARRFADEAIEVSRVVGDDFALAEGLWARGYIACEEADWPLAVKCLGESVPLFDDCNAVDHALWARRTQAWAWMGSGDEERGWALHEENLEAARAAGSDRIAATLLAIIAVKRLSDGVVAEAIAMLREALLVFRSIASPMSTAAHLVRVALALVQVGRVETATRLLAASRAWRAELGVKVPWVEAIDAEVEALLEESIDADASRAAFAEQPLEPADAVALALGALEDAAEPV